MLHLSCCSAFLHSSWPAFMWCGHQQAVFFADVGSSSLACWECYSVHAHNCMLCALLDIVYLGSTHAVCARRGGVDAEADPVELCCILVHTARAAGEGALATLLAAWLHWFGRLELQQALQARCPPSVFPKKPLLDASVRKTKA